MEPIASRGRDFIVADFGLNSKNASMELIAKRSDARVQYHSLGASGRGAPRSPTRDDVEPYEPTSVEQDLLLIMTIIYTNLLALQRCESKVSETSCGQYLRSTEKSYDNKLSKAGAEYSAAQKLSITEAVTGAVSSVVSLGTGGWALAGSSTGELVSQIAPPAMSAVTSSSTGIVEASSSSKDQRFAQQQAAQADLAAADGGLAEQSRQASLGQVTQLSGTMNQLNQTVEQLLSALLRSAAAAA